MGEHIEGAQRGTRVKEALQLTTGALPQGANVIVQQQERHLRYNIKTGGTLSGDASIHGLYSEGSGSTEPRSTTVSRKIPNPFGHSEPSEEERRRFMNNAGKLETYLRSHGIDILDTKREEFYAAAADVRSRLERGQGKVISAEQLQKMSNYVNSKSLRYVELKVMFVRVGVPAHTKGSKQRADGLWTKTTTVRNIAINSVIPDKDLPELISWMIANEEGISSVITNYRITASKDGKSFKLEAIGTKA